MRARAYVFIYIYVYKLKSSYGFDRRKQWIRINLLRRYIASNRTTPARIENDVRRLRPLSRVSFLPFNCDSTAVLLAHGASLVCELPNFDG